MKLNNPILERIREALRQPAPVPGRHHDNAAARMQSPKDFSQWLPQVSDDPNEQLALFAKNSLELKTEFHLFANREQIGVQLIELSRENNWKRIATHHGALNDEFVPLINTLTLHTDAGYDVAEMEQCDVGITECDALVAQTGSVLVTSKSAGGRALSVLPPHHVVLARREQFVPDLAAAYEVLRVKHCGDFPSLISFITGPSRTGDIERILVLGAHGPKRLTVLCA